MRVTPIKFETINLAIVFRSKRVAYVEINGGIGALGVSAVNDTDIIPLGPVRLGLDTDRRDGEECCEEISGEQHRRRRRAKIKMREGGSRMAGNVRDC